MQIFSGLFESIGSVNYFIFGLFPSFFDSFGSSDTIGTIINLLVKLIILVLLIKAFENVWLFHRRSLFKDSIEWTLLEIQIPREVLKTPRAMEQFFMNLHGLRNVAGDLLEKYIDGEVTLWWSLELASFGGEVHFYIRTPKKHKKMTEAGLYAQYPTVEIMEVEDYLKSFPDNTKDIYEKGYNLFGGELLLKKEDAYPIITYEQFELSKDEMALDPISAILEVLAGIQKEEMVFVQILVRPAGSEWQEVGKALVDKLIGREKKEEKKSKGAGGGLVEWVRNIILAPAEQPTWGLPAKEEKKETKDELKKLTPGEKEVLEAVEKSIAKPGFETQIRYLYYAPKSIFSTNFARRGLIGAFNQYASPALNSFKGNPFVETRSRWIYFPHIFVARRVEARKQRILHNFRNRRLPEESSWARVQVAHPLNLNLKSKTFILNTAEMATIFHIPSEVVLTSPHIKRLESKRMGPPAGLPIFKEEE